MKIISLLLATTLPLPSLYAEKEGKEKLKPELIVAADGFPAGNATPEGAACDLARAFIQRDVELFRKTCITPFGGGENKTEYAEFLKNVGASIEKEAKKVEPSPSGPKAIGKVFAARHLSLNGPASAGYAMFDFHDIMFVDVGALLASGEKSIIRTLVIMKKDRNWFAHPAPHTASLLSAGLNGEADSTKDFSEAYTVKKAEE